MSLGSLISTPSRVYNLTPMRSFVVPQLSHVTDDDKSLEAIVYRTAEDAGQRDGSLNSDQWKRACGSDPSKCGMDAILQKVCTATDGVHGTMGSRDHSPLDVPVVPAGQQVPCRCDPMTATKSIIWESDASKQVALRCQCNCLPNDSAKASQKSDEQKVRCCLNLTDDSSVCSRNHAWSSNIGACKSNRAECTSSDQCPAGDVCELQNQCSDVMQDYCGTVVKHDPANGIRCKRVGGTVQPAYCMMHWTETEDGAACREWAEWIDPAAADSMITSYCNNFGQVFGPAANDPDTVKAMAPECMAQNTEIAVRTPLAQCMTYNTMKDTFQTTYGPTQWDAFSQNRACWWAPIRQRSALLTSGQRETACSKQVECGVRVCDIMKGSKADNSTVVIVNQCSAPGGSANGGVNASRGRFGINPWTDRKADHVQQLGDADYSQMRPVVAADAGARVGSSVVTRGGMAAPARVLRADAKAAGWTLSAAGVTTHSAPADLTDLMTNPDFADWRAAALDVNLQSGCESVVDLCSQ